MLDPAIAIDRINAVFGRHPGKRALHAKGAFYAGTFVASPRAGQLSRAQHLDGREVPLRVRWSNGAGNPNQGDHKPDVRGMALSFRVPDAVIDVLGQTAPRFVVRTPEAFVEFVEAAQKPWLLPRFLLTHRGAGSALVANAKAKALMANSFAEVRYYPIHAQGWRDADDNLTWVRFVLVPVDPAPAAKFEGPNRLFDEIDARLAQGPVRFELRATVAAAGDDPNDPMSVWTGAEEFSAGVITVERRDDSPEADGGLVVFDPTRVVDGIELPDDPILKYRAAAYSESASRRASS